MKFGNLPGQNQAQAEDRKYTKEANPIRFKPINPVLQVHMSEYIQISKILAAKANRF